MGSGSRAKKKFLMIPKAKREDEQDKKCGEIIKDALNEI